MANLEHKLTAKAHKPILHHDDEAAYTPFQNALQALISIILLGLRGGPIGSTTERMHHSISSTTLCLVQRSIGADVSMLECTPLW